MFVVLIFFFFSRCELDGETSIPFAVATALSSDNSQPTLDARTNICLCSCASEIIAVYSGILRQWSIIDPQLISKITVLLSMCSSNNVRSVSAKVTETTSVQCATNILPISINVSSSVPSGSAITIYGLNAMAAPSGLQLQSVPASVIGSFQWSPAVCPAFCAPTRQCPGLSTCNSTGSGWMSGVQRPSRCGPWCDEDAVLQITTNISLSSFNLSVTLQNGCLPNQPYPTLYIAINGPNFYVPMTPVLQNQPVLTFQTPPNLVIVSVTEAAPDTFDNTTGIWRGNALGQLNTLTFVIQPNVDIYAGANITIIGLISSSTPSLNAPTIRQMPGLITNFVVDSWIPSSGQVVIRVSSFNTSVVMTAGSVYAFGLQISMPTDASNALKQSPLITLEASGLGPSRACCCIAARQAVQANILIPMQTRLPFFPLLNIGQSTCYPGECNTISVTIAINRAIYSPRDSLYIMISGLFGIDTDPACSPTCDKIASRIPLQDLFPGAA